MEQPVGLDEQDDRALLSSIARGDKAAFQAFYRRHAGRLLEYAVRASRDRALAEEIVQEVFVTVWTKAAGYEAMRGAPQAWLYVITRSKLVDRWRSAASREQPLDPEQELGRELSIEPESDLALSISKALEGLSPEQRKSIEMAYFGGYTQEEAAAVLKVPLGTLKSRIRAALSAMRGLLGAES